MIRPGFVLFPEAQVMLLVLFHRGTTIQFDPSIILKVPGAAGLPLASRAVAVC